jgi:hypothetical protein
VPGRERVPAPGQRTLEQTYLDLAGTGFAEPGKTGHPAGLILNRLGPEVKHDPQTEVG